MRPGNRLREVAPRTTNFSPLATMALPFGDFARLLAPHLEVWNGALGVDDHRDCVDSLAC